MSSWSTVQSLDGPGMGSQSWKPYQGNCFSRRHTQDWSSCVPARHRLPPAKDRGRNRNENTWPSHEFLQNILFFKIKLIKPINYSLLCITHTKVIQSCSSQVLWCDRTVRRPEWILEGFDSRFIGRVPGMERHLIRSKGRSRRSRVRGRGLWRSRGWIGCNSGHRTSDGQRSLRP